MKHLRSVDKNKFCFFAQDYVSKRNGYCRLSWQYCVVGEGGKQKGSRRTDWTEFARDSAPFIEELYRQSLQHFIPQRRVVTGGSETCIFDFKQMTQKFVKTGKETTSPRKLARLVVFPEDEASNRCSKEVVKQQRSGASQQTSPPKRRAVLQRKAKKVVKDTRGIAPSFVTKKYKRKAALAAAAAIAMTFSKKQKC